MNFEQYLQENDLLDAPESTIEAMRVTWDRALIEAQQITAEARSPDVAYYEIHKRMSKR